jgi:hypothetical protein
LPLTLQLTHSPPVVASLHALSQHTPSVQFPLEHCAPLVHWPPFDFLPHELFTHVLGGMQSVSAVQEDRHALLPQRKGEQDLSGGVTQLPRPSQFDGGVAEVVPTQLPGLHPCAEPE